MRAGKLDRRVKLQRYTVTQNTLGEEVQTWVDVATVWAGRRDLRGTERYAAQQMVAKTTVIYTIRYRAGLTPLNRLIDGSDVYDIQAALQVGRKEGLELHCEARAENGAGA